MSTLIESSVTPRSVLPSSLTSYDFLKFAALALMIVDHIGYYLMPDELWIRVAGRFSAPIWLFLIGYAKSRDLTPPIWIGMIVLVLSNYVVGHAVLPVNILGTIIVCRLLLDPLMVSIARSPKILYGMVATLFFGTLITFPAFEYGSVAMLPVMTGYMIRNRESLPFAKNDVIQFTAIAALAYAAYQAFVFFDFDMLQEAVVMIGILALMLALTSFRPYEFTILTRSLPHPLVWLIQLCGRHSLAIYVIHILIFKVIGLTLGLEGYKLFDFHILE